MEHGIVDWSEYLKCERGLLVAPAGHGKTTAIADCLILCPNCSCQLVLTHTHAGIASLKKKFKEKNVPSNKYQLETITGFAQRYVLAFLGASVLPDLEDQKYFSVAVLKCLEILNCPIIQNIISLSFDGVFVDEYQDCTISQHNMILALAKNLPLHILGDPLQGIFNFEDEKLVNFDTDLSGLFGFKIFDLLNYPWRWHRINEPLGHEILNIRNLLTKGENCLRLSNHPEKGIYIELWPNAGDSYSSEYLKWMSSTIRKHESQSTLVLCPSYFEKNSKGTTVLKGDLPDRIKIKNQFDFKNNYLILDAIDGGSYYTISKKIDSYIARCAKSTRIDKIKHLFDLLASLYVSKTFLSKWFSSTKRGWKFKDKKNSNEKEICEVIKNNFNTFKETPSLSSLLEVLNTIKSLNGYSNHRPDFWGEIIKCVKHAISEGESLYKTMEKHRSRLRHIGRKIEGRCIGTTLLTKGLEFDTVILLNADKFQDKKHFYVAISRACRKLVMITHNITINFKMTEL